MRTDVKLGVFLSMVVVLGVGGYIFYPSDSEAPIPLTGSIKPDTTASSDKSGANQLAAGKSPSTLPNKTDPIASATRNDNEEHSAGAPNLNAPPSSGAALPDEKTKNDPTSPTATGEDSPRPARMTQTSRTNQATQGRAAGTRPHKTNPGDLQRAKTSSTPQRDTPPTVANNAGSTVDTTDAPVDTHRIQPGDTFVSLAQAYYGSSNHASFIMEANPNISDPTRLRLGTAIRIPPLPSSARTTAQHAATATTRKPQTTNRQPGTGAAATIDRPQTYRVQAGDSFYRIARDKLGDANRWNELLALNKTLVDGDPMRLQVGHVILLPKK